MKIKNMLILCLIICFICSLQAVSSADVDVNGANNDILATDDVFVNETNDHLLQTTTESEDVLSEGEGSFSDLQTDISTGDVVELTRNYTFDSSSDSSLTQGITISGSKTINGNGNVVIDAKNQARIFNVASGSTITLTGITFVNANAGTLNGGAIYANATIYVDNCKFINNTANRGGALYLEGHDGTITNSVFEGNKAAINGGAIRFEGSNWRVEKSTFNKNSAVDGRGGAIYLEGSTNTTIDGCNFTDNFANINGGAVEWYVYARDGKLLNSIFTNNIANRSGGAVYWYGDTGVIRNTKFTGNKALGNVMAPSSYGDETTGGDGGAVMWTGINGIVDDCTFTDNYASQRGGAVFLQGSVEGNCTNTSFSSCTFISNEAGLNGGALDWHEGAHDGLVTMSVFKDNKAASNGGAIFWSGHNGRILHSNFTNNTAKGLLTDEHGNMGDGGAIIWSGINGTVDDCRFIDNNASQRGGGVFLQNCTHGNCTNTSFAHVYFENNYAGVNGGAIDWHAGAHEGYVEYGVFVNNTANRSGGAIFWFGTAGEILYSNFTGNKALGKVLYNNSFGNMTYGGHGGAVMWTGANGIIDGCTFTDNDAAVNGGAIFMQGSTAGDCRNVTVSNSVFNDNFAGVNGGAVDWYKGARYCTLENATFNNNIANRSGGAVFWYGYHGTIKNATFTNNQALGLVNASSSYGYNTTGGDGGAVMWTGSDGIIDGCTFTENYAAARGGAVFLQGSLEGNCTNVTVSNSNFEQNKAETNGGAVNFFRGAVNGRILNSTFKANEALTGIGGAVVWRGYNGTIDGVTFNDNKAPEADAGAVYIEGDSCKLLNTEFDSNLAGDDGGAVYWTGNYGKLYNLIANNNSGVSAGTSHSKGGTIIITGSNMTVDLVEVSNGYAEVEGGGLFLTGNNVNITNVQFYYCYVDEDTNDNVGGALDIIGNNTRLINATIIGSSARYGGAIDWAGDDGYACNIALNNNHVTEDGAALRIVGDRFEIENSVFNYNEAGDDGGAIYWSGDDGIARNLTFYDNKGISSGDSSSNGGTMAIIGSNITVEDSSFKKSSAEIAGGAIFVTGNNVNITGSSFDDCSVSMDKVVSGKDYTTGGGAIYILGNDTHIMSCTFDNTHGREGGVIYVHGNNAIIDNATTRNAYALNGGTFYIAGANAIISNSDIGHSYVTAAGGAIYINGQYAKVLNTTVDNTYAKKSSDYDDTNLGGAVYINGAHATIDGSTFTNSEARNGGIVYLIGDYCNIINSTLTDGYSERHGGAIYCRGSYCTVTDSNISENIANYNGGAIYWDGGSNSIGNSIYRSLFVGNIAYANTGSKTRGGGALYYSEGGRGAVIKDTQFINDSVQTTNNVEAEGGAILWDYSYDGIIDNCTFDGCFLTSTMPGSAWIQGGAIYLRSHNFTFNNCVFANCWSINEAGALYLSNTQGTIIYPYDILINNTKFINNTAKSPIADNNRNQGGGAIQAKECYNVVVMNSNFINNTASKGGAYVLTTAKNNGNYLENCTFEGNTAWVDGGSIHSTNYLPLLNVTIIDSVAGRYGGGAYLTNLQNHYDVVVINNSAECGGGIYSDQGNVQINNMVFINNTATADGGALYIVKGGAAIVGDTFINNTAGNRGGALYLASGVTSLTDLNFTGNKAFTGSAIYGTSDLTLKNVYLIENQANSSSLTFEKYDESTGEIILLFKGYDNYLNGVYLASNRRLTVVNVTYWSADGVTNSGASSILLPQIYSQPTPEAGQNITVEIFDDRGNVLNPNQKYFITDADGKIYLNLHDLIPDVPQEQYSETYTEAKLTHDDYYTIIRLTTRAASEIDAVATNTTYHSNSTISVNVTHGATGNVSVYLDDIFLGNISLNNSEGSLNLSTLIEGKYLPVGNYTLNVIYNGNAKYDVSNTTAILEITKITPVILLDVTGIGYNLLVNVTVLDGEYGIADATGEVTIQVAGRTATIYLGNSQGMTIIYGLPIGNYTVNATYGGDQNYYNATNSTNATVSEKTQTVLVIDVDSEKLYYINETVPIKVTILPEGEGNITLYINGVPHVLTLQKVGDSTFVEFNATELKDGVNYVFATYQGTTLYAPSWAEDLFHVIKYNATVEINTTNITVGETEVINITLPEDATGILNVTVNGTSYYVEIVNGTVSLPLSGLGIGVYNVTAIFNGDWKYYNATNSTLFNVTKATPTIIVSVENITYGENATVIVTLPEGVSGNVTIKLNETIVFVQEHIDGQASFILENLKAGNYTIVATFNGNENYTVNSNSTKFTVFKATPVVDVTVEDIIYGDAEHITITVNTNGTVTVKVAGKETTLNITTEGNETFVYDLAVGNYPVEVTFNGNENYTNLTVVKNFNVYKANTTMDVQVQNITVWDMESINVALADNAPEM